MDFRQQPKYVVEREFIDGHTNYTLYAKPFMKYITYFIVGVDGDAPYCAAEAHKYARKLNETSML